MHQRREVKGEILLHLPWPKGSYGADGARLLIEVDHESMQGNGHKLLQIKKFENDENGAARKRSPEGCWELQPWKYSKLTQTRPAWSRRLQYRLQKPLPA